MWLLERVHVWEWHRDFIAVFGWTKSPANVGMKLILQVSSAIGSAIHKGNIIPHMFIFILIVGVCCKESIFIDAFAIIRGA